MGVKGVKLGKETETEPEMNGAVDIMTVITFFFLSQIAKIRL